jgi:hypothetical protein
MRKELSTRLEESRLTDHPRLATPPGSGPWGAFHWRLKTGVDCYIIADDARDWDQDIGTRPSWEHVSVHIDGRCPTWEEMCEVKRLFWLENETVVEFHPAQSEYVNCHPHTLHLWKMVQGQFPVPPKVCV